MSLVKSQIEINFSQYFNTSEANSIKINNSQDAERVLDALSEMEDLYSWDQQNV